MAQIYSVTYYKNDGSGTSLNYSEAGGPPLDQITSVGYNWDQFSPDPQGYDWSRSGYTFVEWNTSADGTGTSYAPGAMNYPYTLSIYAIWQAAVVTPDITISYNSATIAIMSASGTEVLETDGTYMADDITIEYNKPSFSLQAKTGISPSTSSQTITPDSGYDGLSSVQIDAMTTMTLPTSTSSSALGSQKAAITPTTSTKYLNIPIGYNSTRSYYKLNAISPTKAAQTYIPTTSNQTIASGQWLTGEQTILGDANLVAGNIASGVTIFGVTGTHTGGTDVSDTTATAADVLTGKYFYTSAGVKTQGTITVYTGMITDYVEEE